MAAEKETKNKPEIGEKKKARLEKTEKKKIQKDVVCFPANVCVKVSDKDDKNRERIKVRYSGTGKRCPFLLSGDDFVAHCIGEYCMFWNEDRSDCNINAIAQSLEK
ncbi:MAG: hypothetical protein ABFC24_03130 [Methanoregulaceae archaeon]